MGNEIAPTRPAAPGRPVLERSRDTVAHAGTRLVSDHVSQIVQRMMPETARPVTAMVAQRPREAAVSRPGAAWRALGDWRAVLVGTAVLGAAALLGPVEAGVIAFATYRMFREPLPATFTDKEAFTELSESVLHRIGKRLVAGSAASLALHVIEVGGLAYFGYRIVRRWRARRRQLRGAQR